MIPCVIRSTSSDRDTVIDSLRTIENFSDIIFENMELLVRETGIVTNFIGTSPSLTHPAPSLSASNNSSAYSLSVNTDHPSSMFTVSVPRVATGTFTINTINAFARDSSFAGGTYTRSTSRQTIQDIFEKHVAQGKPIYARIVITHPFDISNPDNTVSVTVRFRVFYIQNDVVVNNDYTQTQVLPLIPSNRPYVVLIILNLSALNLDNIFNAEVRNIVCNGFNANNFGDSGGLNPPTTNDVIVSGGELGIIGARNQAVYGIDPNRPTVPLYDLVRQGTFYGQVASKLDTFEATTEVINIQRIGTTENGQFITISVNTSITNLTNLTSLSESTDIRPSYTDEVIPFVPNTYTIFNFPLTYESSTYTGQLTAVDPRQLSLSFSIIPTFISFLYTGFIFTLPTASASQINYNLSSFSTGDKLTFSLYLLNTSRFNDNERLSINNLIMQVSKLSITVLFYNDSSSTVQQEVLSFNYSFHTYDIYEAIVLTPIEYPEFANRMRILSVYIGAITDTTLATTYNRIYPTTFEVDITSLKLLRIPARVAPQDITSQTQNLTDQFAGVLDDLSTITSGLNSLQNALSADTINNLIESLDSLITSVEAFLNNP